MVHRSDVRQVPGLLGRSHSSVQVKWVAYAHGALLKSTG